jgi:hypothetical protein
MELYTQLRSLFRLGADAKGSSGEEANPSPPPSPLPNSNHHPPPPHPPPDEIALRTTILERAKLALVPEQHLTEVVDFLLRDPNTPSAIKSSDDGPFNALIVTATQVANGTSDKSDVVNLPSWQEAPARGARTKGKGETPSCTAGLMLLRPTQQLLRHLGFRLLLFIILLP